MKITDLPEGLYYKELVVKFTKYRLIWNGERKNALIYMAGTNRHITPNHFVLGICSIPDGSLPTHNITKYYARAATEIHMEYNSFYNKNIII